MVMSDPLTKDAAQVSLVHSKLLRGPLRRRMRRDVPVPDSSRADLQDRENVDHAERYGDGDEKVAREDSLRVIADKRAPPPRSRPLP